MLAPAPNRPPCLLEPPVPHRPNHPLFLPLLLTLTACGGALFEREPGVDKLTPLPPGAEVLTVESMKDVPAGSETVGTLRTRRTVERLTKSNAEKQMVVTAAQKGCDLLADLHEQHFDGPPRRQGATTIPTDEYEWQAKCVRTSVVSEAAAAPGQEDPAAKNKSEQQRLQAELTAAKEAAKKAAKLAAESEKLAADKAEQLRQLNENAEKDRKKQAAQQAERQKREKEAELERQKREREQAEHEKQRQATEAAEKARAAEKAAVQARAAAESAEKERKRLAVDAAEKAKAVVESGTPAAFKSAADAAEKARLAAEAAEKAKQAAAEAEKEAKRAGEVAAEKAKGIENEKARAEAVEKERKAREAAEKAAADQKAKTEAEQKVKLDAEQKAKADAEQRAKADAEKAAAAKGEVAKAAPTSVDVAKVAPVVVDPKAEPNKAEAARLEREAKLAEKKRLEQEKKQADAEKKRLADEKRAQELAAKKAEQEQKRLEAEKKKQEAAEKKRKSKELPVAAQTDVDRALQDGSVNALLEFVAKHAETEGRIAAALDKKVAETPGEWVVVDSVVVSTLEDERGPKADAESVAREVQEAQATGAKFLTPREYSYRYALKNPANRPVALDVQLPGQRMTRVLAAGQQVMAQATVPCIAHGAVTKKVENGILEFHFECNADSVATVLSVRPIERELVLDKRAADVDVPVETMAKIWDALPATALTGQFVLGLEELTRKRGEWAGEFSGRLATQRKNNPDAPTAVLVTIRNQSSRDGTVIFDVGTGKEQRLLVNRGQTGELKLDVPAPAVPDLKILGVLPRLRSLDWLLGVWTFKDAKVAILPGQHGQWTAYLIPADGGKVIAVGLHGADGILQARSNVPAAFVQALFGTETPSACSEGCELSWLLKVAEFDQYVTGAGRALPVEFEAADRRALVKMAAEH